KLYQKNPSTSLIRKLFKASERLSAEDSIKTHMIDGLSEALKNEKLKRKRGKKLNLKGEERAGPQFFSPRKIEAAWAYQAKKDLEEVQHRQDIDNCKAAAASKKQEKELAQVQRAEAAQERQKLAAVAKIDREAKIQAQKELRKNASSQKNLALKLKKQSCELTRSQKAARKQGGQVETPVMVEKEVVGQNRHPPWQTSAAT
ncbi:MAG: hypothetical protein M1829_002124, partial [Trizodia sp. TS-e1964]